jgi:ATP-dependent RNA helicase RhlE
MPREIRHLADELLRNPAAVQVDHGRPTETVAHALYPVPGHLKSALLLELLRGTDTESVIVFTRTKHRAKKVGQLLERSGHRATSLQGNLSQNRRQAALTGFRNGTYTVLVATDIAARGIDVTQISHVINYDIPDTVDAYTHRIGRTGRLARTGDAFTFVAPEDGPMVRSIERVLGEPIERRTLPGFDYRAPAPERPAAGPRTGRPAAPAGRSRRQSAPSPGRRGSRLTGDSRCGLISPTAR